jgi:alkaline phosphatase
MKHATFLLLFLVAASLVLAQEYTSSSIHAHNDYVHPIPFLTAYYQHAGSIEADIFLHNGELYVAHEEQEILPSRTLDNLYLEPLQAKIKLHDGAVYPKNKTLNFLIDLKTDGILTAACKKAEKISNANGLQVTYHYYQRKCSGSRTME